MAGKFSSAGQRLRILRPYRLLGQYCLVAVDAAGVFSFDKPHGENCLTKKSKNGKAVRFISIMYWKPSWQRRGTLLFFSWQTSGALWRLQQTGWRTQGICMAGRQIEETASATCPFASLPTAFIQTIIATLTAGNTS
ncbi:MAG: hypothetical protein LBL90_05880 [Prevotellaceae bacterium]|jgi:hypothetical protein|nr:hypothetical protein [Prevotellaceae bacterium]